MSVFLRTIPSERALERAFPGHGKAMRRLLLPCRGWCSDERLSLKLEQCAALVGCTTEGLRDTGWSHYWCDAGVVYINVGDTYLDTLLFDTRAQRLFVSSWGDFVERHPKRFP